ncbi:MAG: HlyD family efflux transporter periplasmic adaptor subunit [Kouleothrix sp.]|nr:HlyD family efflux transporter periplasmic adaptor subunit [Kouleothrix sp.]
MKRTAVCLILVAALAALLSACGGTQAQQPTAPAEPVEAENKIMAEAKVVPTHNAALSFQTGGTIAEVLVSEGDQVKAGQAIARLESDTKAVSLARAEAQLKAAEARLQDLTDGPRADDVAAAEAQLRQAQAQLKQTIASVTPEDIAAAQAQIKSAQSTLTRLEEGLKSADVRAAQAQLQQAQSGLDSQRSQLSAGKTNAELQLSQAADRLVQAQTAYSTAKWHWEHVQEHGTDPITPSVPDSSKPGKTKANALNETQKQQYQDAFTQAERSLHSAELAVQQAQVAADNARQTEASGVQVAEASVSGAQANLDRISSAVQNDQLDAARAQLASARASLARLRGPQRDNQVAIAQAGVDAAQASLDRLKATPQPSELTAQEAQVDSAKADRDAAKLALEQVELKAPFAGQVAALDLRVGEAVAANAVVAQLADTSAWQIETTDLTELNVAQVSEGDAASIKFDALPDLELPGHVLRVKAFGENHQGDIVYRVIVQPDKLDQRLRWNMTASVAITPR